MIAHDRTRLTGRLPLGFSGKLNRVRLFEKSNWKTIQMTGAMPNRVIKLLALTLTPWVMFISSGLSLFLTNQENLDYNAVILLPFVCLTAVGVLVGFGIQRDSQKNNHYLAAPWLFLLAGPTFLLWSTFNKLQPSIFDSWAGLVVFLAVFLSLGFALRKIDPLRVFPFFALFAFLVLSADVIRFAYFKEPPKAGTESASINESSEQTEWPAGDSAPANIYHIVLDGYQSDVFDYLLNEKLRTELSGFTNFRYNTTHFGKTRISLPVVFDGRLWGHDLPFDELTNSAFNSRRSLLGIVLDHGYLTRAHFHQDLAFSPNLFQQVWYHHEFREHHRWTSRAFWWLWIYTYWPSFITEYFLPTSIINKIKSGQLSPEGYPVLSLDVFRNFIAREKNHPGRGRYEFLHLILPHPPYMLTEDCEVKAHSSARDQFRCANLLIVQLVRELKRLGRFNDSMIIIHADHGDDLRVNGASLEEIKAGKQSPELHFPRSKALLLFKPFGDGGNQELVVDETRSTLLDIAPTIAESLGHKDLGHFEGTSLTKQNRKPEPRYYFIDTGRELHRFIISDSGLSFDKIVELR
jgi:hypothetical protein